MQEMCVHFASYYRSIILNVLFPNYGLCIPFQILARGCANEAGLNDLVCREEENWGVGSQVTTSLINDKDEVRVVGTVR